MQQATAQVITLHFSPPAEAVDIATLPILKRDQGLGPMHADAGRISLSAKASKLKSGLVLGVVLLAHAYAIYLLMQMHDADPPRLQPATPMLVSLIAPPAPEPELVPVIEPPKPEVKPKPVLKKVDKTIKPVDIPVEKSTETVVEQTPVEPVQATPAPEPVLEVAQPKAPPAKPVIEEKIEPPKFGVAYLNNPEPNYPRMSRRAGEEGRVLLRVLVSEAGAADQVSLEQTSGFERLDEAAIEAVKKWKFIPARKNNQNISAQVLVPIKFSISN